jgi:hypothetical protein
VIGEAINFGKVRVWITSATAKDLERIIGSLDVDVVSDAILKGAKKVDVSEGGVVAVEEAGVSIVLRRDAYGALIDAFPGVNDEHCFRFLDAFLKNLLHQTVARQYLPPIEPNVNTFCP